MISLTGSSTPTRACIKGTQTHFGVTIPLLLARALQTELGILLFAATAAMSRRDIIRSFKPTATRRRHRSSTTPTTRGSRVVRYWGEPEASYGDAKTSVVDIESSARDGIFYEWHRRCSRPSRSCLCTAITPNMTVRIRCITIRSMGRRHRWLSWLPGCRME
jgi:hypothetical protein